MAQQSDKWHHSMARYLGQRPDTFFMFGIQPGVCREAIGRTDLLYTKKDTFDSDLMYSWSRFHYDKIRRNKFATVKPYYGTCPFMWELGVIAVTEEFDPKGSLFYLPRDDQVTIRDAEYSNVQDAIDAAPKPITFLVPFRSCDVWKDWTKLRIPEGSRLVSLTDPEMRQYTLARLLHQHEHIYIPWPGTDLYYAAFLGKEIHLYDKIINYRTKHANEMERTYERVLFHLKWGYDFLTDKQKTFFHWTERWNDIDIHDRAWLVNNFLGLDALKPPHELHKDMLEKGYLHHLQMFTPIKKYYDAYEWIDHQMLEATPTSEGYKKFSLL